MGISSRERARPFGAERSAVSEDDLDQGPKGDTYSAEETAQRRDAALRRALDTPLQPRRGKEGSRIRLKTIGTPSRESGGASASHSRGGRGKTPVPPFAILGLPHQPGSECYV